MKNSILYFLIVLLPLFLQSCTVVGGIFKAGMVWGILIVVIVVVAIISLISRRKK